MQPELEVLDTELRRIGRSDVAGRLREAASITATTSSELIGEIGNVLAEYRGLRAQLSAEGIRAWDAITDTVNRAFPGFKPDTDVLAGPLFMLIGAGAVCMSFGYPMGTAARMGPGYFPFILGGTLVVFGAYLFGRGFREPGRILRDWGWRPLALVTLAMLLFGFLVQRAGLVPALAVMFPVCALGGREFRWREVIVLTVVMTVFAVALFVYGLKLPFRLFPDTW